MRIFILFIALTSASLSRAEDLYGYIRIQVVSLRQNVPAINPTHYGPGYDIQLKANGSKLGSIFNHATISYKWQPVGAQNLNPNGNRTQITTNYSFGEGECNFDYEIYFSFDQRTEFKLGVFHAPSTSSLGWMPIGGKCEGGMRVCSSEKELQVKFEKAYRQGLVNNFNKMKAEYDQAQRAQAEHVAAEANRIAEELKNAPPVDDEANRKILQAHIDEWNKEFQKVEEESAHRFDDLQTQDELSKEPLVLEDLAQQALNEAKNSDAHLEAVAKADQTNPEKRGLFSELDEGLPGLVEDSRALLEQARLEGTATPDDERQHKNLEQNVDFFRRQILRGQSTIRAIKTMARVGLAIQAPWLSTAMTICEVAGGYEYCMGRPLSVAEREQALCRLILKYGIPWRSLQTLIVTGDDPAQKFIIKGLFSKVRHGVCGVVISD